MNLRDYTEKIEQLAGELGLEYYPVDFELVPQNFMLEIAVYGVPVRMHHWSFGVRYIHQLLHQHMAFVQRLAHAGHARRHVPQLPVETLDELVQLFAGLFQVFGAGLEHCRGSGLDGFLVVGNGYRRQQPDQGHDNHDFKKCESGSLLCFHGDPRNGWFAPSIIRRRSRP